jgi:hypothetical protein
LLLVSGEAAQRVDGSMAVPPGSHTPASKPILSSFVFSRKHKDFAFLFIEQKYLKVHASYEANTGLCVIAASLFLIGY